jgi:hypothetical protein
MTIPTVGTVIPSRRSPPDHGCTAMSPLAGPVGSGGRHWLCITGRVIIVTAGSTFATLATSATAYLCPHLAGAGPRLADTVRFCRRGWIPVDTRPAAWEPAAGLSTMRDSVGLQPSPCADQPVYGFTLPGTLVQFRRDGRVCRGRSHRPRAASSERAKSWTRAGPIAWHRRRGPAGRFSGGVPPYAVAARAHSSPATSRSYCQTF